MKITMKNRWLIVLGAVIVQICIGTIYSWSMFNYPLMDSFGWSENEVVLTFSIATFIFAFSTMLSGRLLDLLGPRIIATIGGVLYGGGLLLASTANSLIELYIYYGILSGMGVGFVYVCPLATCVKWYPNKKGLITGIAVGAFGLGSLVFKFIIQAILNTTSITNTFMYLGLIYLILIILGAQLLRNPKEQSIKNKSNYNPNDDFTIKQMVKKPYFYLSWFLFYIGCMGGLLVIGLALDLGVKLIGLTIESAANTVVLIALFNALGRITWGSLSDKIGRIQVLVLMFIITGTAMLSLSIASLSFITFFTILASIAFCFGGFLAVFPTITEEFFGKKNFGSNYGIMYQAYGFAALSGPVILTLLPTFQHTFTFLSIIAFMGMLGSLWLVSIIKRNA